jgi:hypothetical protein
VYTAPTFDWSGPERAHYYRALADALSLSDLSVVEPIRILLKMPCTDMIMPSRTMTVEQQVIDWIAAGEQPHLSHFLRSLFGVGFCSKQLPAIPACAAFYVRDAEEIRERLKEAYERWGYHEHQVFAPDCEGTGYIARQLAFAAHCIENGCGEWGDMESAAQLLRESLYDWAPLFARALVVSRVHPAVMFVGMKLECLLDHEHELGGLPVAD